LTPEWLDARIPLALGLRTLAVLRPSTVDLILTKMMRADENDLSDIRFLLSQESMSTAKLEDAFARARKPTLPEIGELFQAAKPKVVQFVRERG
jgi:hypothetical protein